MTQRDYIEVTAKIAILRDVAQSYPGRTIENIIQNLESIKKYMEEEADKEEEHRRMMQELEELLP